MEVVKPEPENVQRRPVKSSPIRVSAATKKILDDLLNRLNSKRLGRRIKPDEVISKSLHLLSDSHLAELKDASLTNLDRFEMFYQEHAKSNPDVSKDELIGLLLTGELASSKNQKKNRSKSTKSPTTRGSL